MHRRIGTGEYMLDNTSPLCRRCNKEISKVGYTNDPLDIDGAWSADYNCFLHNHCYDKIVKHRERHRADKMGIIREEADRALKNKTAMVQKYYNLFDAGSHRQCTYCDGTLTDLRTGILYPRKEGADQEMNDERDFYGLVALHIDCFNKIKSNYLIDDSRDEKHALTREQKREKEENPSKKRKAAEKAEEEATKKRRQQDKEEEEKRAILMTLKRDAYIVKQIEEDDKKEAKEKKKAQKKLQKK